MVAKYTIIGRIDTVIEIRAEYAAREAKRKKKAADSA